ncbi:hypothetical protein IHQ68_04190 [Chelatococcus sambhunathii]|uniref:Lipoprotein n=1 Tax=Chelatococcus sambhunathii TaxID=363953 RepID=A0ABU1DD22_9HYPH|nr:hypothetical protein [Chelatococcus sambhunathii]MDR4305825.1 hypothetical protein [Chelatococcus sambhunathii]
MDKTTKQTALFFGFLASAMTCASTQPVQAASPAQGRTAVERQAPDLTKTAARAQPGVVRDAPRTTASERRDRS